MSVECCHENILNVDACNKSTISSNSIFDKNRYFSFRCYVLHSFSFSILTRFSSSVGHSAKLRVRGTLQGYSNIALKISLTSCYRSKCLQNKSSEVQVLYQFVTRTRTILIRALMKPLLVEQSLSHSFASNFTRFSNITFFHRYRA